MRVLVVDDSAFMRRALTSMIDAEPSLQVIGTARNGLDAVKKAKSLKPDVITMDVEMPEMDGLTALQTILRECEDPKPAVLMCSSLTTEGSHTALEALKMGASDIVAKDHSTFSKTIDSIHDDLVAKIKAIGTDRFRRIRLAKPESSPRAQAPVTRHADGFESRLGPGAIDLIVIGSSTGGPPALEKVLTELPESLGVPVVIAQHMPPLFTKSLSERLNKACRIRVAHADAGTALSAGCAYIIQGGKHGKILRSPAGRLALEITSEPKDALYKPSVDVLLRSAAGKTGERTLAVVLTGMGEDGGDGAAELKRAGGVCIAQDAESCVVYGMPRAVAERGNAEAQLPPPEIGRLIARCFGVAGARAA